MKCYIATAFANAPEFHEMKKLLEDNGHEVTVDWTTEDASKFDGDEKDAYRAQIAATDTLGVYECDAFIFLPAPNMAGAYVELGMAFGFFKRVVIVNPFREGIRECIFYHLPKIPGVIEIVNTKEDVLTFLKKDPDFGQIPNSN